MKTSKTSAAPDIDLRTLTPEALAARKDELEAERVRARDEHRAAAAPIVAEQFRRAREAQIVARLRNNLEPKPAELAYLAGLSEGQVLELDRQAGNSIDACRDKNADWRPARSRRKYDLMTLVRQARKEK